MKRFCVALIMALSSACFAHAQMMESLPETEIKIFSLVNVASQEAGDLLKEIFGKQPGETIAIDARTNSVIANSTPDRLEMMEAILLKLDGEKAQSEALLEVYRLKYGKAVEFIQILDSLFAVREDGKNTRIGLDPASNSIIVRATPAVHQEVKSLISNLDQQSQPTIDGNGKSILFEIYWIGNEEGESPLPEDISEVLAKQKKQLGISQPFVLGQASAACFLDSNAPGGQISLQRVKGFNHSTLDCQALIVPLGKDSYKLDIRLSAGRATTTSIDTTIRTQLNHLVFVASTTIGDDTIKPTIFVLKLSDTDELTPSKENESSNPPHD